MNFSGDGPNLTEFLLLHFNSTNSADFQNFQLYSLLHNSRQNPLLIVPASILALIGLIGIPLNAAIIYTTIKFRKTLNRNANYLLALNAFFDLLQLTHPFPFLAIALSGTNFVGTFHAFCLILPSIFGIQCSLTAIACTGFDRLFSVILPLQYHQMSKRQRHLYCALHTAICIGNGLWNAAGLWQKCLAEADKPVTGFIGQIGWDSSKDFGHYLVGPVLIWATIFCYLAIGILLCLQQRSSLRNSTGGPPSNAPNQHQKLLKSLVLIVGVHTGTSLFGSLLLGFSSLYSTILTWYIQTLSLSTILLGACSNAVVLYLNSAEYRSLFILALSGIKNAALRTFGLAQIARIFTISTAPIAPLVSPKPVIRQNRTAPLS